MSDFDDLSDPAFLAAVFWENGINDLSSHQDLAPFVYYIQSGPLVKIGTSVEPEKRADQLRRGGKALRPSVGLAEDPRLIAYHQGSAHDERNLHHRFKHLRDQGEWFWLDAELAAHIQEAQQAQSLQEYRIKREREVAWFTQQGWGLPPERDYDAIYRAHCASKEQLTLPKEAPDASNAA